MEERHTTLARSRAGSLFAARPLRRLAWALLTALLSLAGFGFYLWMSVPTPDGDPHNFNRDHNAAWVQHRWLTRKQSRQEVEALVTGLAERGIRYLFPHLIPFDREGRLPAHDRDQMRAFLNTARRVAPEVRVLPWIGGLRLGYRRTLEGALELSDLVQRQRIVAECRGLIDEGFHGVHVNVEPVDNGNVEFLALLRALRTAIGSEHVLSVSATRPAPVSLPGAPNFAWTTDYYARVGAVADQLVVMTYDTALPRPGLYRRYVSYATRAAARSLARRGHATVLMGLPTYDATGLMHRAEVESLENALYGVIAGLRSLQDQDEDASALEGVALYAAWTTGPEEWERYEQLWRRSVPKPARGVRVR